MAPQKAQKREFTVEKWALWRLTFGPWIWALHFVICYSAVSVSCAKLVGPEESLGLLRLGLGLLTLLSLAATAGLAVKAWRQWDFLDDYDYEHSSGEDEHRHEFLGHAAFLLAVMSFVAIIYTGLPLLWMETCV